MFVRQHPRVLGLSAFIFLQLAAGGALANDEGLTSAYAAILRGDFSGGQALVDKLRQTTPNDEAVQNISNWLNDFSGTRESRDELRNKTYEWDVEQARKNMAANKLYLALTFASQASQYADDGHNLTTEDWFQDLRKQAMEKAKGYSTALKWSRAHGYYWLLERINPRDEEIKELREQAARHVRLEVIYRKKADLERRIARVNDRMLEDVFQLVEKQYYAPPDFRKMADGALSNLTALVNTAKLYETLDGIATKPLRESFVGKLEQKRDELSKKDKLDAKDLIRLYRDVANFNKETVEMPKGLVAMEFVEGAMGELDEFSSVIWPAEENDFDKLMRGEFKGVGIQLGTDELTGRLKVVTPLENSPALEAGIQPNDLIIEVDGKTTKGWSTEDAVHEITGEAGSTVKLTMFRPSTGKKLVFPLVRRPISLTSIRGVNRLGTQSDRWNYMLDAQAGISYIQLTGFNPDSTDELEEALKQAKQQGMKGLILDLRGNPGGLLETAINIVSLFQPKGEVVSTRGRVEDPQRHKVGGDAPYAKLPLVVLVNENSASASEILSGALQDHDRAVVIGSRTFGKGSVQRVMRLNGNAQLKLTTALYYLPKGESPHKTPEALRADRWGVAPDLALKLTPKETIKVIEHERKAFIIHNEEKAEEQIDEAARKAELESLKDGEKKDGDELAGDDVEADDEQLTADDIKLIQSDPYKAPEVDPQLQVALLQLRVKLAANLPWPRQIAAATPETTPAR